MLLLFLLQIICHLNHLLLSLGNKNYKSQDGSTLWRPIYAPFFTLEKLPTWYLQNTEVGANSQGKYCVLLAAAINYQDI